MVISGTEVEIVSNPYKNSTIQIDSEYDENTKSLFIKGEWHDDLIDFILKNNIKGLYLNYTKGFKCDSFDFLFNLKNIELLNLIYTPVESLKPIESLENLKSLSISCHWKNKIDFSNLQNLNRCFIGYDKGADSIFECCALRYLYIDQFKLKSFENIQNLTNLEYLTIGNSTFNEPEILGDLKELRKLVLLNCKKLEKLCGIGKLINLEWLTIDGSKKIFSIKELSSLINLNVLQLSNNKEIETLSYIKSLKNLKAVSFFGDTIILDGDFKFMESLDQLSMAGFAGRRHYTHKPARSWNWKNFDSKEAPLVSK